MIIWVSAIEVNLRRKGLKYLRFSQLRHLSAGSIVIHIWEEQLVLGELEKQA